MRQLESHKEDFSVIPYLHTCMKIKNSTSLSTEVHPLVKLIICHRVNTFTPISNTPKDTCLMEMPACRTALCETMNYNPGHLVKDTRSQIFLH